MIVWNAVLSIGILGLAALLIFKSMQLILVVIQMLAAFCILFGVPYLIFTEFSNA